MIIQLVGAGGGGINLLVFLIVENDIFQMLSAP